jgi:hypothetical protein
LQSPPKNIQFARPAAELDPPGVVFGAVSRFFFHLYNDEISLDEEGRELADIGAARDCAIKDARDMAAERYGNGPHFQSSGRVAVARS